MVIEKTQTILALIKISLLLLLILLVVKVLVLITEVLITIYTRSPNINTQAIGAKHTRSK